MAAAGGLAAPARERLRRRADFLKAASGAKAHSALLTLQMRARGDDLPPRIGFTVTRRAGTATERNRIRRRLRAAAALVAVRIGCDYVIVARRDILEVAFARLAADLARAVQRVNNTKIGAPPAAGAPRPADA